MKIIQFLNDIKNSPFKSLKRKYYLGKIIYGTPYFYPINFCSSIIKIRKLILVDEKIYQENIKNMPWLNEKARYQNLPIARRTPNKIIKIFNKHFYLEYGTPIILDFTDLGWKDKFNSPRFEWGPSLKLFFFSYQFCIFWKPTNDEDYFWEMFLWWKYYANENIAVAEKTWKWIDMETNKSTWNKNNLK